MWVIFLEIGVVILIAALIVWWTWPKKRRKNSHRGPSDTTV
jgi:hypothetical protein